MERLEAEASRARVAERIEAWERRVRAAVLIQRCFRSWVRRRLRKPPNTATAGCDLARMSTRFLASGHGSSMPQALQAEAAIAPTGRSRSLTTQGSSSGRAVSKPRINGRSLTGVGAAGAGLSSQPGAATQHRLRSRAGTDGGVFVAAVVDEGSSAERGADQGGGGFCGAGSGIARQAALVQHADDEPSDTHMWITAAASTAAPAIAPRAPSAGAPALSRMPVRAGWKEAGNSGDLLISGLCSELTDACRSNGALPSDGATGMGRCPSGVGGGADSDGPAADEADVGAHEEDSSGPDFLAHTLHDAASPLAARTAAVHASAVRKPAAEGPPSRRLSLRVKLDAALSSQYVPDVPTLASPTDAGGSGASRGATAAAGQAALSAGRPHAASAPSSQGRLAAHGGTSGRAPPASATTGRLGARSPAAAHPHRQAHAYPATSLPPIRVVAPLSPSGGRSPASPLSPAVSHPPGYGAAGAAIPSAASPDAGRCPDSGAAVPCFDGAQQLLDKVHLLSQAQQPTSQRASHGAATHRGLLAAFLSGVVGRRLEELPPLSESTVLVGCSLSRSPARPRSQAAGLSSSRRDAAASSLAAVGAAPGSVPQSSPASRGAGDNRAAEHCEPPGFQMAEQRRQRHGSPAYAACDVRPPYCPGEGRVPSSPGSRSYCCSLDAPLEYPGRAPASEALRSPARTRMDPLGGLRRASDTQSSGDTSMSVLSPPGRNCVPCPSSAASDHADTNLGGNEERSRFMLTQ